MKRLNKYKIYYRYWYRGSIVDGEAILKFVLDPPEKKVFDRLVKIHNYPKNSRAAEYSIIIIKTHKLI
jgi:hypothetical protein